MSCVVYINVFQPDGKTPASFTQIKIYKVVPFLWWEINLYDRTVYCDFYGRAAVNLYKDLKYRFDFMWIDEAGRRRYWSEWRTFKVCPTSFTTRAPP
jgi:hypothetical protein